MKQMASMDFFIVPTALFRVLFVFVVLSHDLRRVVHFNVAEHPTETWTAQQIREAFPWDEAPRYLIRDRDAIFGKEVIAVAKGMGIKEVVTAAQSPWQNPYGSGANARVAGDDEEMQRFVPMVPVQIGM